MTKEEKQKAIDTLKISVPIKTLTQEEFNNYIKTLNKIMDWLEQEDILDKIRAEIIENSIEDYIYHGCGSDELIIETNEALKIIDKYKAESEDK